MNKPKQKITFGTQIQSPQNLQQPKYEITDGNNKYYFELSQQMLTQYEQKHFFKVEEIRDSQNQRQNHWIAFGIKQHKVQNININKNVKGVIEISQTKLNLQFCILLQKRDLSMIPIRAVPQLYNNNEFIFSLLFFVNYKIEKRKEKLYKECDFSMLDNIYYKKEEKAHVFKVYFTELYILNTLLCGDSKLTCYDLFCNLIQQLYTKQSSLIQESQLKDQIDLQPTSEIKDFFQWCKNPTKYCKQINQQLNSQYCNNKIKKCLTMEQIDNLQ